MTVATSPTSAYNPVLRPAPGSSGLYEVVDLILDKGLVIDAYVRVSLVGIELLTVDARIVVASVDTYLRFADAANRLDLRAKSQAARLTDIIPDHGEVGTGIGRGAADEMVDTVTGNDEEGSKGEGVTGRVMSTFTGEDEEEKKGKK